ncbi:MAG TPA: phosphotransferase family protein [Acidimicrobiia bacterium]|nr:phosphotransferase family protein [Acidimicrobiia bacterium]
MTDDDEGSEPETARPQTFTRDLEETRAALESWLAARRPDVRSVHVPKLDIPATNGMSTETLLFDAVFDEDGTERAEPLVARVAPDPANVPVFREYDLEGQFEIMRQVALHTSVPVPRVHWLERDRSVLGAPFFVMEKRYGVVPPDLMPYPFGGNWLFDAPRERQMELQNATIAVIAELHAIEQPEATFPFLDLDRPERTALGRHVGDWTVYYDWIVADGLRSPLLERALARIHDTWPEHESAAVFNWGDSRIGNVLYRDFQPIAVLDWEMAALSPRELDLSYCVYIHWMFQEAVQRYGGGAGSGMPHFMRPSDALTEYERITGYTPRDFEFYALWNATRYGMISARIGRRAAYFAEAPVPDDPDDMIMNRDGIERMLAGTYWKEID